MKKIPNEKKIMSDCSTSDTLFTKNFDMSDFNNFLIILYVTELNSIHNSHSHPRKFVIMHAHKIIWVYIDICSLLKEQLMLFVL